ncbi:MAG: gliding motility-associated C-terminal domain-containing protein [Bacteroidia bacterium]|nr:gliding motility-associated C-terminal domain-containing protein [Bacteroidia bacterium]
MQSEHTRLSLFLLFSVFSICALAQPTFNISSIEDDQGETVCVDITVQDFTQIQTLQFSVNWDPSVATFDRVENYAVASLTASNFNFTQSDDGKIAVSWEDFSFEGTTLEDGDIFFSICLQLTGEAGQFSTVGITGDPVTIDVTDANSNGMPIGQTLNDGEVRISENGVEEGLILYYDDVDVENGGSFCVPIRARNFQNITALQFSINFNNNRFRFDQIQNLENWNGRGFASPSTFNANSQGQIGYAYIDFSFEAMGNDLEDGGVIFEICLTHMLDETCINDAFILSDTPTEILATQWPNDEEIQVSFEPGRLKAGNSLNIDNVQITNTTCTNPNGGSIELTVSGGEQQILYNWSNGESSNRIENIDIGNYSVTVSDQCLGVDSMVANYSIQVEGVQPSANAGMDVTLTCQNTSVALQGSGSGATNLSFSWRGIEGQNIVSSANSSNPVIDETGIYELMVTNTDNGCSTLDSVEVFSDIELPNADAGSDTMLQCGLPSIMLNASSSSTGPDISYAWTTTDGNIISDPNQNSISVDQVGAYQLRVRNEDSGCESTDQVVVSGDNTMPLVGISGSSLLTCANPEITLNASNGGNPPNQSYSWTTADGNILSGANAIEVIIDQSGNYQVTVTHTMSSCTDEASFFVAADFDKPMITASNDVSIDCDNPVASLSVTGPTNVDYFWSTASGEAQIISGQNTNGIEVMGAGTILVIATDTDNGCSVQDTVEVFSTAELPNADAGPDKMLQCGLTSIMLSALASSTGPDISYSWTTTDGNITTNPNQDLIFVNQIGTYQLTVINKATGCEAMDEVIVSGDNTMPLAAISGSTILTCTNPEIILNANNGGNAPNQSYSWNTTDGNFISGLDAVEATIDQPGTYQVTVTNTLSSCTDETSIIITADREMPMVMTSNDVFIDCNNQISSVSASGTANVEYSWTISSGEAQIISGQNTSSVDVMGVGTIVVMATNGMNGCSALDSVRINVNNDLPLAIAGDDFDACNAVVTLSANGNSEVTGQWTSLQSSIRIVNPNDPNTQVTDLQPGENTFIWTLNSDDCGPYSSDTLRINLNASPIANDDAVQVNEGFGTVNIDLLLNDSYPPNSSPIASLLSAPSEGSISGISNGAIDYTAMNPELSGTYFFNYELCDDICSTNCDTATVTIVINPEATVPVDTNTTITKEPVSLGITPNGDGLNEFLVFDELIFNPNKYQTKRLIVYNRWGDIVHESQPYQNNWSGTNQSGQSLPQGTYYFVMQLDIGSGAIIEGDITILK